MAPRRGPVSLAIHLALTSTLLLLALLWLTNSFQVTRAQPQPEAFGSMSGVVVNSKGEPLFGIEVTLEQYASSYAPRYATTDAEGRYHVPSLYPGIYHVKFTDPSGHYAASYYVAAPVEEEATNVTVDGSDVEGIDMTMALGGAISLTVTTSQPVTTPITIMIFRLGSNTRWQSYRDLQQPVGEGAIRLGGLPFGLYRLCVRMDTAVIGHYYQLCYDEILAAPGNFPAVNATDIIIDRIAPRSITLDLEAKSQVRGKVLDPNNEPLAGIVLWVESTDGLQIAYSTISDEDGDFQFGYIPPGNYKFIANYLLQPPPDYLGEPYLTLFYPSVFLYSEAEELEISLTSSISATMKLSKWGQVSGTATLKGGVPLVNPIIRAYAQEGNGSWPDACTSFYLTCPRVTYDHASAIYTMTHLIPNQYRFSAEDTNPLPGFLAIGYYGGTTIDQARSVMVRAGKEVPDIDIEINPAPLEGIFTGTVTGNGDPLPGIVVGLYTDGYSIDGDYPMLTTTTDALGQYQIEGIGTGIYRVRAHDPTGRYATRFFELTPGQIRFYISGERLTPNINLDMSLGGSIRGRILTPDSEPPSGYRMVVFEFAQVGDSPHDGFWAQRYDINVKSDINGAFEIKGLRPKDYLIAARVPEFSQFEPFTEKYYPGTFDQAMAQPVTVQAEQTTSPIDISFEGFSAKLPFIVSELEAVK